jgi:hypothetical protein
MPPLAALLPSSQYGGSSALSVRSLRDVNLLEVKISAPTADEAKSAMTAAVDQLVAEHAAKMAPLIESFQSTAKSLEALTSDTIRSNEALTKRLSETLQGSSNSQDAVPLMSARASAETGVGALVKSMSELKILSAIIRPTRAVTSPSVTTPKASSLWRTIIAGALAGFLLGLLMLQIFPGLFADFRSNNGGQPLRA